MVSFLREMDILEKAKSRITVTQKQFMLKRKTVEKLSPQDNINAVISHGLSSVKGKSKYEESRKVEQKYEQHSLTQCL
mgnify:CR=1 FL=1